MICDHATIQHQEEGAMTTLARPGVPAGGFKTIGQVRATNDLVFTRKQNAMGIAVELLTTHTPGAPVVDGEGRFAGFISEFDILRALEAGKDLNRLAAEDIMVKLMEDKRLLNLPIERNGKVVYSITRHDLLRAWIGLGVDIESNAP
jgi:predicted transcriptional regulator